MLERVERRISYKTLIEAFPLISAALALTLVTFAFAGCGETQTNDAGSAEQSSVSAEAESGVIKPAELGYTVSENMPDGIYNVDLDVSTLAEQEDGTYKIHATIEAYDIYDIVDMNTMKEGDTIQVAGQEVKIDSVTKNDSGLISINGGTEEGGYDFISLESEDGNGYRTVTMDDYPLYYSMGETDLTISAAVKVSDALGDDPSAEPTVVEGSDFASYMQEHSADAWTCGSTSVSIENGQVVEVNRIWVP